MGYIQNQISHIRTPLSVCVMCFKQRDTPGGFIGVLIQGFVTFARTEMVMQMHPNMLPAIEDHAPSRLVSRRIRLSSRYISTSTEQRNITICPFASACVVLPLARDGDDHVDNK